LTVESIDVTKRMCTAEQVADQIRYTVICRDTRYW